MANISLYLKCLLFYFVILQNNQPNLEKAEQRTHSNCKTIKSNPIIPKLYANSYNNQFHLYKTKKKKQYFLHN